MRHIGAILCLSNGDAFGEGEKREKEMRRSCERVGIGVEAMRIGRMRDGIREKWEEREVEEEIRRFVEELKLETVRSC